MVLNCIKTESPCRCGKFVEIDFPDSFCCFLYVFFAGFALVPEGPSPLLMFRRQIVILADMPTQQMTDEVQELTGR